MIRLLVKLKNKLVSLVIGAGLFAVSLSFVSCGDSPTGLRSLAPRDSVIYIETPDIGRLLKTLAENSGAARDAGSLDPSILDGVELAVAVTGFSASELQVTDAESVLNFKPQFTLIADTHAWSWQVKPILEGSIGKFVATAYGPGTKLETGVRDGFERYTWTAPDGRKAFAAVKGTLVFFSNSEGGVDAALAVSEKKAESLLLNERLSIQYANAAGKLAFGFVSKDGVKQLSQFAGVSTAIDSSEELAPGQQSAVAGVLSQVIGNAVEEIVWTSVAESGEMVDVIDIRLANDISKALVESMRPESKSDDGIFRLVPGDAYSVTRYNLRNPRVAFRSLILASAAKIEGPASALMAPIGASLLEPYGVEDPEGFLSACEPFIVTVQFDEDGDKSAAIVKIAGAGRQEAESERLKISESGDLASTWVGDYLVLGDPDSVKRCLAAETRDAAAPEGTRLNSAPKFAFARRPEHTAVTVRREGPEFLSAASIFGKVDGSAERYTLTMTDFERSGVKRTYRSKLGFPGYLIALFSEGG